jgi:hypothetical protein
MFASVENSDRGVLDMLGLHGDPEFSLAMDMMFGEAAVAAARAREASARSPSAADLCPAPEIQASANKRARFSTPDANEEVGCWHVNRHIRVIRHRPLTHPSHPPSSIPYLPPSRRRKRRRRREDRGQPPRDF